MNNRSLLIVDDEPNVLNSLKREFKSEGYDVFFAQSGMAGLNIMQEHNIGVVMSDYMMPEMDGVAFLKSVKKIRPDAVRIMLTAYSTLDNSIAAINQAQIFAYLMKPWSSDELKGTIARAFEHYDLVFENKRLLELTRKQNERIRHFNENLKGLVQERTLRLEEAVQEGIIMLALAAEAKDDDTGDHIYRIQSLTRQMCIGLGLSAKKSEEIGFFSIMHDVGKIHIPDSILKKPGPLTHEEFVARIVAVADVFDALTHKRPYKEAWPVEEAVTEMETLSGRAFDPRVMGVFVTILNDKAADNFIPGALYDAQI